MSDRLPWTKGDRPNTFTATVAQGVVELWLHESGSQADRGWRIRMMAGKTVEVIYTHSQDRQHGSDQANTLWPGVVRKEHARVVKIEAREALHRQVEAAHETGFLDVTAFDLGSSDYDRLVDIVDFIRRRGWLEGALRPLVEATSAELYQRRTTGR